jgi:galactokinase
MSQERKNKIYRAAVPGRVNLIGEWIDFNGGTVLPMALKRSVRLEMRPNDEEKDRVSSAQYEDLAFIDCNAPAQEHWSDYVRGSLQYARARGWIACGMDVTLFKRHSGWRWPLIFCSNRRCNTQGRQPIDTRD